MKDGGNRFPVYFLGALVIQANMAKVPCNPSDGLLVPTVGKGAVLFWRDTDGGVVRHCWTLLVYWSRLSLLLELYLDL